VAAQVGSPVHVLTIGSTRNARPAAAAVSAAAGLCKQVKYICIELRDYERVIAQGLPADPAKTLKAPFTEPDYYPPHTYSLSCHISRAVSCFCATQLTSQRSGGDNRGARHGDHPTFFALTAIIS